jgi:hypothetical protein
MHGACGVIDTACMIFALENRSYLGEFEAEFKLTRESEAQGVTIGFKKPEGRKSRDIVPLTKNCRIFGVLNANKNKPSVYRRYKSQSAFSNFIKKLTNVSMLANTTYCIILGWL